jgi:hypothetical protein
MKPKWIIMMLAGVLLASQASAQEHMVLKSRQDRDNYSAGVTIARNLKQQGGEINLDVVIKGMTDELRGEHLLMTEEEIRKTTAALEAEQIQKQKQAAIKRNEMKAKAGGEAARAANAHPDDSSAIKKEEGMAQKTEQGGQITPNKVATSVVERSRVRSEVKKRAAEMRKQILEQHLGGI